MTCNPTYSKLCTAVMLLWLAIILFSCNPYKQLASHPPLTTKDSAALLARCIKVVPIDTAGNVVYISYPDSSEYWKQQVKTVYQSITDTLTNIYTKYKDTCTTAIKIYQQGLTQGYNNGYSKCKEETVLQFSKSLSQADSLYNIHLSHLKQSFELKSASDKTTIELLSNDKEKYRTQSEKRGSLNMWLIIACAVLLILNILQWKFKRQEKTANNVINDVRTISK